MAQNDFLVVAGTGTPNVETQAAYAASDAVAAGYVSGVVPSNRINKSLRQSTVMASVLAQLIVAQTGNDAIDDGSTATLLANLTLALQAASAAISAPIVTTGGTTVLTVTQAAAATITVTGVLASNAIIQVPSTVRSWGVVNKTTGAYTLTVQAAAGTGSTVTQGKTDRVQYDGANVVYASADTTTQALSDSSDAQASTRFVQRAVSLVGGFYQDTGAVNALVITTVPVTTSLVGGESFRVRVANTNTITTPTLNVGTGAITIVREDGGALEAGDLPLASILNVTYVVATNRFVANEVLPSQYLDSPAFIGAPTAPTAAPGTATTQLATCGFVQTAQTTQSPERIMYSLGLIM